MTGAGGTDFEGNRTMDRICQNEGCFSAGLECRVGGLEHGKMQYAYFYYCPQHAAEEGFCGCCGEFWAGIDSFDLIHPGLCDHCYEQLAADRVQCGQECQFDEQPEFYDTYDLDL
jgi:hypothetical protein